MQAGKITMVENPNQINKIDLQNLRRENIGIFRKKEREYLKGKINELLTNNRNKNIRDLHRGMNELKRVYQ
jgi:hypothetical protein